MKSLLLTFCCTLPLLTLSAQEQYMKSVVRITAQIEGIGEETGAGIIVGKEGAKYYIVTARHVVHSSDDLAVQVHGDKAKYKATVLHQDEGMDAAALVFTPEKTPVLRELIPADADIIKEERKVKSIGHPGGSYWLPNSLNLVQQTSFYEDERFFSITPQAVIGGCSGGPVFTETGAWLGIITETSAVQAKCLKAEVLDKWLRIKKVPSNFIYTPMPEMVRIEGKKPRADSFAIYMFYDDEGENMLPYYEFKILELNTFLLGKYEVTLREFEAFIISTDYVTSAEQRGSSNAIQKIDEDENQGLQKTQKINWRYDDFGRLRPREEYNRPVIHVSWEDADAYCKWLSKRTGKKFRLPSSDEWVYAFFPFKKGALQPSDVFGNVRDLTWYGEISIDVMPWFIDTKYTDGFTRLAPAGSYTPNEWGLHDMYGNVSEWCSDGNDSDGEQSKESFIILPRWYLYLGPNWLFWYRDDKKLIVKSGYIDLFDLGETTGRDYIVSFKDHISISMFPPDESNCFIGFRVAGD